VADPLELLQRCNNLKPGELSPMTEIALQDALDKYIYDYVQEQLGDDEAVSDPEFEAYAFPRFRYIAGSLKRGDKLVASLEGLRALVSEEESELLEKVITTVNYINNDVSAPQGRLFELMVAYLISEIDTITSKDFDDLSAVRLATRFSEILHENVKPYRLNILLDDIQSQSDKYEKEVADYREGQRTRPPKDKLKAKQTSVFLESAVDKFGLNYHAAEDVKNFKKLQTAIHSSVRLVKNGLVEDTEFKFTEHPAFKLTSIFEVETITKEEVGKIETKITSMIERLQNRLEKIESETFLTGRKFEGLLWCCQRELESLKESSGKNSNLSMVGQRVMYRVDKALSDHLLGQFEFDDVNEPKEKIKFIGEANSKQYREYFEGAERHEREYTHNGGR